MRFDYQINPLQQLIQAMSHKMDDFEDEKDNVLD